MSVDPMDGSRRESGRRFVGQSRSLLGALGRHWWMIVATTIILAATAGALAYVTRDNYHSTVKLLFDQTIGPQLNALGLNPPFNNADRLAGDSVAIVGSRSVAQAAARRLGQGQTADDVQRHITVSGDKTSDVVSVTASASSAAGAARLGTAYSQAAADLVETNEKVRAQAVLADLKRQLAAVPRTNQASASTQTLMIRITNLGVIARTGTGNPQIIQPAYVPVHKDVKLAEMIILGAVFGLVLGATLALLRDRADARLRYVEEVSAAFDAPVLATIPRSRQLARRVPFAELPTRVSEAFFMLQSNLHYRGQGDAPHSFVVTSGRERQGKTTVAYNLARAAAAAGFNVIFVDADLRRSTLANDYSLRPFPGLSEVLHGDIPVAHAVQSVPVAAEQASNGHDPRVLSVVVAGSPPPDPAARIQSPRMVEMLDELTARYDIVVVDTPPIAQVADAIPLLRRVDGVLVVASVNSTRGPDAERLREHLQALDAPLLGVVANGGSSTYGYASYASTPAHVA